VIVRTLSFLSIACIAVAIGLVVFGEDQNTPVVVVLVLAAFGITTLLGIRAGYHKARSVVRDASAFVRGDVQHARLVDVGDPKGVLWPKSTLQLELEGEDGQKHAFERDVPVPFVVAWSYRLGKRFNLPLARSTDLGSLMAFELRREGMDVTVGRGDAPESPV
jgi:hypothetical protein